MTIPAAIAKALVAIQADVRAMGKTAKNDHFKNTYAPLDEVMDTALPLLTKNKLSLMQWPITVGTEHFLHTVLAHESGVSMQSDTKLLLTRQDPQSLGSALTYERRQTVMAILGLSSKDEDDDGNKASGHFPAPTKEQIDQITAICKDLKYPAEQIAQRIATIKTQDHAIIVLNKMNSVVSMKARDEEAKERAASVPVEEVDDSTDEYGYSQDNTKWRLNQVGFKDSKTMNQFILKVTKKPLIGNCKSHELQLLNHALDELASGDKSLPDDWLAETKASEEESV